MEISDDTLGTIREAFVFSVVLFAFLGVWGVCAYAYESVTDNESIVKWTAEDTVVAKHYSDNGFYVDFYDFKVYFMSDIPLTGKSASMTLERQNDGYGLVRTAKISWVRDDVYTATFTASKANFPTGQVGDVRIDGYKCVRV